jgi:hypothetical protein
MRQIIYFVMQFMFINNIKLVGMVIRRYQCQYGPNDFTNVVKDIT